MLFIKPNGGTVKTLLLSFLTVSGMIFAADMQNQAIPHYINIPFFDSMNALRAKQPTSFIQIPITLATTPSQIQAMLRNTTNIHYGVLTYGDYQNMSFLPEKIDNLPERNHSIQRLLREKFDDFGDLQDSFFFFLPPSKHKTKKQHPTPPINGSKSQM